MPFFGFDENHYSLVLLSLNNGRFINQILSLLRCLLQIEAVSFKRVHTSFLLTLELGVCVVKVIEIAGSRVSSHTVMCEVRASLFVRELL
jgi:hypothetical protein